MVHEYHIARSPNYYVADDTKYTQYWYQADGGSRVSNCYPSELNNTKLCDTGSWSDYYLTDVDAFPDSYFPYVLDMTKIVPNANLKTLPDLVGATVYITDGESGHYIYMRKIVQHTTSTGTIKVDRYCKFDEMYPALRVFSKYYVENKLALLDSAGM